MLVIKPYIYIEYDQYKTALDNMLLKTTMFQKGDMIVPFNVRDKYIFAFFNDQNEPGYKIVVKFADSGETIYETIIEGSAGTVDLILRQGKNIVIIQQGNVTIGMHGVFVANYASVLAPTIGILQEHKEIIDFTFNNLPNNIFQWLLDFLGYTPNSTTFRLFASEKGTAALASVYQNLDAVSKVDKLASAITGLNPPKEKVFDRTRLYKDALFSTAREDNFVLFAGLGNYTQNEPVYSSTNSGATGTVVSWTPSTNTLRVRVATGYWKKWDDIIGLYTTTSRIVDTATSPHVTKDIMYMAPAAIEFGGIIFHIWTLNKCQAYQKANILSYNNEVYYEIISIGENYIKLRNKVSGEVSKVVTCSVPDNFVDQFSEMLSCWYNVAVYVSIWVQTFLTIRGGVRLDGSVF